MTLPYFGKRDGNKEEKKVQIYLLTCLLKTFWSQVQVKLAILSLTVSAMFFNSQNQGQDSLAILGGGDGPFIRKVFTALLANVHPEQW